MRLINRTTYNTAELRALVREACKGLEHKGTTLEIAPARKQATGAAWTGSRYAIIRIPPPGRFPYSNGWKRHRSSPLNHDWQDWREAVVALAAHEIRHLDLGSGRHRRWTKQRIEMSCEAFEHGALKRYRERTNGHGYTENNRQT